MFPPRAQGDRLLPFPGPRPPILPGGSAGSARLRDPRPLSPSREDLVRTPGTPGTQGHPQLTALTRSPLPREGTHHRSRDQEGDVSEAITLLVVMVMAFGQSGAQGVRGRPTG